MPHEGGASEDAAAEQGTTEEVRVEEGTGGVSRRELLKRFGSGGIGMLGAGVVVGSVVTHSAAHAGAAVAAETEGAYDTHTDHGGSAEGDAYGDGRMSRELPVGASAGPYGGEFSPPDDLDGAALDSRTVPPPAREGTQDIEVTVVEHTLAVSRSHAIDAWTYNGTAPGPTIRATEGDLVRVYFTNNTDHDHNLHFHGRHSPTHDGWEPVPPGGSVTYEIEAGPAGVHPYHCHTMPIDEHISRGLYGTFIVDPLGGRPAAHEVVLALSGWDVDGDRRNEVYTWNGIAGFYEKFPIKIPAGEPVRAYVLNMTEFDPIASFHLHAATFDVWPSGMGAAPAYSSDIITLGQMDRAILEFTLPERGRYMFHPHQHAIAHRGAMGWFSAI